MTHTGKTSFVRKRHAELQWTHSIAMLVMILTACNPAMPATQILDPATRTEMPSASLTPIILTSTISPAATEETYPTYTPAPTSTAIATLSPGESVALTSLHMSDELDGWGIDSREHILHTTDGGHTWKDVTPQSGGYRDSGFFALDADTAWATPYQQACYTAECSPKPNNATVWHTSDGGDNWQEQHICLQDQDCGFNFDVFAGYYYPIALHFSDAKVGWLLVTVEHLMHQARYRVYRTTDGGAHWSPVIDNMSGPWVMSVTGLAFQDEQTGWLSTSQIDGATDPIADWSIYQSTDTGLTWNEFPLPVPDPLPETFAGNAAWCGAMGVALIRPEILGVTIYCRVYTNPMSEYEFYFYSADGGQQWTSWLKTGDVEFIDPNVGWRSTFDNDAYDLERTRDGGQTWTKLKTVSWKGDLEFVNEQAGWAIAADRATSALVRTTDGGQTWEELKPIVTEH